jgi:putative tryptophan/tyrosine transport system substrate-binding protein
LKTGVVLNLTAEGCVRRREFIKVVAGSVAAFPLGAHAQQSAMPVVGFVNAASAEGHEPHVSAFLKGLSEAGYVDGRNVAIEYRWAEGRTDRLPAMVADLVHRQVAVIAATSTPAAVAAKAATTVIPIVFEIGVDPVELGLVASLNRPGGNVTGVTQTNSSITPKRLELLHEFNPNAKTMALLVDPAYAAVAAVDSSGVSAAAQSLGIELHVLTASTERDFDAIFAKLTQLRAGGLVIGGGGFFLGQRKQLGDLSLHHAMPAVSESRDFAVAGGLMSYGADIPDAYRLAGIYTGRVLNGDKPADLPVQQSTKVEFRINLKTAKALGITVPLPLSGRADELIE